MNIALASLLFSLSLYLPTSFRFSLKIREAKNFQTQQKRHKSRFQTTFKIYNKSQRGVYSPVKHLR